WAVWPDEIWFCWSGLVHRMPHVDSRELNVLRELTPNPIAMARPTTPTPPVTPSAATSAVERLGGGGGGAASTSGAAMPPAWTVTTLTTSCAGGARTTTVTVPGAWSALLLSAVRVTGAPSTST